MADGRAPAVRPRMDNVVDQNVNQVVDSRNVDPAGRARDGFELPLLLFAGFRTIIDELHDRLAREGHPDARPAHGFALQAIGIDGASASEIGRRLGVSKQAAGKTVDRLEALGYAERADDPRDARRKIVRLTPYGLDLLARSAAGFEEIRGRWAAALGERRLHELEDGLAQLTGSSGFRLDAAGWFTG